MRWENMFIHCIRECGKMLKVWKDFWLRLRGREWLIMFAYVLVISGTCALSHEVRLDNDSVILNTIRQAYWFLASTSSMQRCILCGLRDSTLGFRDTRLEGLVSRLWGCFPVCKKRAAVIDHRPLVQSDCEFANLAVGRRQQAVGVSVQS